MTPSLPVGAEDAPERTPPIIRLTCAVPSKLGASSCCSYNIGGKGTGNKANLGVKRSMFLHKGNDPRNMYPNPEGWCCV